METDKLVDFDHVTDYISREAAIALAKDLVLRYEDGTTYKHRCIDPQCIRELPTADVVEVVRCKDCRWWTKQEKSLQGRCELGGFYPTGGWFCANGERSNCGADMREVTP